MDFLAENNLCGQTLLRLVARGNSIIAELKRMAAAIPSVFRLETKLEQQKYGEVLPDFSFFQLPDTYTKKIDQSERLSWLDSSIRERHLTVVCRIYGVFESIHRYASHLKTFLRELREGGTFLHITTDAVFADHDGKQLMCESLYLYGVMLLLLDTLYLGPVRERLMVCHHRHAGAGDRPTPGDTNVDDVCRLLRSTGLRRGVRSPQGYPEDYFRRIELPSDFIEQAIGHLRTDDIYNQVSVYPSPSHRAAAFSSQAAMLYVCLYFSPQTLHSQHHRMREMVDRFFPDNWVVSYYMGSTINLIEAWEPYKAAKQALNNTIDSGNVKTVASSFGSKLSSLTTQASHLNSEGALTEAKVLESSVAVFQLLRESNVSLRWLVLHCAALDAGTSKRARAIRDQVLSEVNYSADAVFDLLLHTARLEFKVTQIYKKILQEKSAKWQEQLDIANSRLLELSEAFSEDSPSSSRPLARVRPNGRLHRWFRDTAEQVRSLDEGGDDHQPTARRLLQVVAALNQVKEYHDLGSCGGAVQAVEEATGALEAVVLLSSAVDIHMAVLATVADLSYAWTLVDQYTAVMQKRIKQEPGEVSCLRAVFLKLASGLELPLLRITQAASQDVLSVSAFYSGRLVAYIRKVLQIIPETMFSLLGSIVELQTHHLSDLPTRLDKENIKDFAQLPQRYKVSELCHKVGVLADGVGEMGRTLVGVLEVQPHQLLQEGVRRELVLRVARIMHHNITFQPKKGSGCGELMERLAHVARLLKGFRSSFEYIQDYINLYALKIWHEELTRIISVNVEQECEQLLPGSSSSEDSSGVVPVPNFPPTDATARNFVGRLANEMLRVTDPKIATYVWVRGAWYDNSKSRTELADAGLLLTRVEEAITIAGLAGVDRLLACRTVTTLQEFMGNIKSVYNKEASVRELVSAVTTHTARRTTVIGDPARQYSTWCSRAGRLCTPVAVDALQRVGQLQLLRLHAAHRLHAQANFQANYLHEALQALNISLLSDMQAQGSSSPPAPQPALATQLTALLEWTGLSQPLERLYITKPSQQLVALLPHVLLLLLLTVLPKLHYVAKLGSVVSIKSSDGVDGSALCVGLVTVLRQLPGRSCTAFLALLAQYIASHTLHVSKANTEMPPEACTAVALLQQLCQLLAVPPQEITALLPGHLATQAAH